MRYNVLLTESVIKIPQELSTAINRMVGNVLMYQLKTYITGTKRAIEIMKDRDEPNQEEIQKQIQIIKAYSKCAGFLNSKFGSKSPGDTMIGGTFSLELDKNKLIDELAAQFNLDRTHKILLASIVNNSKLVSSFSQITPFESRVASVGTSKIKNGYFIKLYVGITGSQLHNDPMSYVRDLIGTLMHEATHIVQTLVLDGVLKDTKQTTSNYNADKATGGDQEARERYLGSPNEFPALLQSFLHTSANQYIQKKIQGNPGDFVLQQVNTNIVADSELNEFMTVLKKNNPEKFKKAIKTLYKNAKEVYDNINSDELDTLEDYKIEYLDVAPKQELMEFFLDTIKKYLPQLSKDQYVTKMLMAGLRVYGTRDDIKTIEYSIPTVSYDGDGNDNVNVHVKIQSMHDDDYSIEIDTTEGFHDSVVTKGDTAVKLLTNLHKAAKYSSHQEIANAWETVLDLQTRYKIVSSETISTIVGDFGYYKKVKQSFDKATGTLTINDLQIVLTVCPINDENIQLVNVFFPVIDTTFGLTPTIVYRLIGMIFRAMDNGLDGNTICEIMEEPNSIHYRISTIQKAMYRQVPTQ